MNGLTVDEISIASPTCESCIQVKQAHQPFSKEAEHCACYNVAFQQVTILSYLWEITILSNHPPWISYQRI